MKNTQNKNARSLLPALLQKAGPYFGEEVSPMNNPVSSLPVQWPALCAGETFSTRLGFLGTPGSAGN